MMKLDFQKHQKQLSLDHYFKGIPQLMKEMKQLK